MTNEQKANEICKKHIFDSNHFDCCMEMADWKDEKIAFALSFLKPKLSANEYAIVCERLNFKE